LDLDFALQAGFTLTLDAISYWEFGLLKLLAEERRRYEMEQIERARNKSYGR
jgi:hypothetical protein